MPQMIRRFGWLPDIPDHRDALLTALPPTSTALPSSVDLTTSPHMPPVYDQGALGSCTANAIGAVFSYQQSLANPDKGFRPSRLFIYYNERVIENSVDFDNGAMIRDGMKSINRQGVCTERTWPYRIERFAEKPPATAYKQALKHQSIVYRRVPRTLHAIRAVLAKGQPFVFGFTVYESFESDQVARTGVVNMPTGSEQVRGGHAVTGVGYDHASRRIIGRNSWGRRWGLGGYFTMPYDYLLNPDLSDDFWTIDQVESV